MKIEEKQMKPWENGKLQVSENHRYLCNGEKPFSGWQILRG